jgi:hypothetical protein
MRNNIVDPILLEILGDWMDRLGRLAKVVVDGDLSQKLHERLGWLAADRAATVTGALASIAEASPLSAQQKLALWESRFDGLITWGDSESNSDDVQPPVLFGNGSVA